MPTKQQVIIFLKKYRWQILAVSFLLLMIILVYGGWFNTDIITRGDWKARSNNWIKDWLNIPFAWDAGDYGGVSFIDVGRIVRYPLYFLQAFFNQVFKLPYAATERIIWFFPFLLISALSIYFLTKKIFNDKIAGFFAVFIFLFNNFVIFRAHGAQMALLMAYALNPLVILFFIKALKERFWLNILLCSMMLAFLGYNDIRLFVLTVFVIVLYGLYIVLNKKFFPSDYYRDVSQGKVIKAIVLLGFIMLILNAFWLLPVVFSKQEFYLATQVFNLEAIQDLSRTNFWHTLSMSIGDDAKFGRLVYLPGQINKSLLFLLPLIVLLSLFLNKAKKEVIFWLGIYLFYAFMAKGLNPPLSFFNKTFYYIPLTEMFRVAEKFMYILATPFAMLYGVACAEIIKRKDSLKKTFIKNREIRGFLIVFFFIFIPFSIITPVFFGKNKLVDTPGGSSFKSFISSQYLFMDTWLNQQPPHYKTINVGGTPSYDFFNVLHPRFEILSGAQARSFFGTYYLNFVNGDDPNVFQKGRLTDIANFDKILGLVNVKYLMLPSADDPDWTWGGMQQTEYLKLFNENNNLQLKKINFQEDKDLCILENEAVLPKIYSAKENAFILGGAKALSYLLNQDSVKISDWNFYFSENLGNKFWKIKDNIGTYLFYDQDINDLLFNSIEDKYKINEHASYNNYYKELEAVGELRTNYKTPITNRDNLAIKQIHFTQEVPSSESYDAWIRMAFSESFQNAAEVIVDYKKNNVVYFEPAYAGQYKWFKLTTVDLNKGRHDLAINFIVQNAAVDEAVLIPTTQYLQEKQVLENYLLDKKTIFIHSFEKIKISPHSRKFFETFPDILKKREIEFTSRGEDGRVTKIDEIGYQTQDQKKNLLRIIDNGSDATSWQGESTINISQDPEDSDNNYLSANGTTKISKELFNPDFSNYSQLVVRLKEDIKESISIFIQDINNKRCYLTFRSSNNWTEYEFNLSDCQPEKSDEGLDWKQIKEIGIDGLYLKNNFLEKFYLDYIYLINKKNFEEASGIQNLWIRNEEGKEYKQVLMDFFGYKLIANIDHDGDYQFIFETKSDIPQESIGSITINQENLRLLFSKGHTLITAPVFLKRGVYILGISNQLLANIKRIIYYNTVSGLNQKNLFETESKSMEIISWQMINPSKYLIKAKVYRPSFINLLDSYDPGWIAKYNNKKSPSVILTTINNSFLIEPSFAGEEMDISLEYEPQKVMNVGFGIFLAGWLFIFGSFVFFVYKKYENGVIVVIIGPDGSGKSTYIKTIANELKKKNMNFVIHYPFNYFLLRKVLDIFRLGNGATMGNKFCESSNKKMIFKFWPIIAILDNWIDYVFRLKKRNAIVLCDRYYYDLATSFLEFGYTFDWLYKIYLSLIPKPDVCFVCDADEKILQEREIGDYHKLEFFKRQRKRYLEIAEKLSFPIINTKKDLSSCEKEILKELKFL